MNIYNRRNTISDDERARQVIRYLERDAAEYPAKLRNIPGAPKGLYVSGRLPDPSVPAAAIIGARICSEYGRQMARRFGTELAQAGVQIVSGMARGIDGISQAAALEAGGSSYGVLGCGVDVCYPQENLELYRSLQTRGGLISEYPPGAQPLARQFPARNRIISGLADIIIVIEAKQKSGTLITVDMALEQGRDVYVVPGRLTDPLSEGCNRLLKQGAGLVLSPEDLLTELSSRFQMTEMHCAGGEKPDASPTGRRQKNKKNNFVLDKEEDMVYASIDLYAKNLEDIVGKLNIPIQELTHILLSLELKGLIKEVGKNHYVRL